MTTEALYPTPFNISKGKVSHTSNANPYRNQTVLSI